MLKLKHFIALFMISLVFPLRAHHLVIKRILKKEIPFICTKGNKAGLGKSHNSFNSKYAIDLSVRGNHSLNVYSAFSGRAIIYKKCHSSSPKSCGHGFGNFIKVLGDNDRVAFYSHLSKVFIKDSQRIHKGDLIGRIGRTGYASAIHLHFSVHDSWKKKGYQAHEKTPVLLPESVPFKLKLCNSSSSSCNDSRLVKSEYLKCSTRNLNEYYFY